MKTLRFIIGVTIGVLVSAVSTVQATPYASGLVNNGNGTMSFYLNEAGGNVTITYEDNSVNPNFNGTTTGLNLPAGQQTFTLSPHTSYTISVHKVGSGSPSLISSSPGFTPRGPAVNTNATSPHFGQIYVADDIGYIDQFNPDWSEISFQSATGGVSWQGGGISPLRLSIAADDYLMVGDASSANAGLFRVDPTISTSQAVFGPGESAGLAAGTFGTLVSRPLVIGNPSTGPVKIIDYDGDLPGPSNDFNCLMIYNSISISSLPFTGTPSTLGPNIELPTDNAETLGYNEYGGISQGLNGYIYVSTYRNNLVNPAVYIFDSTGTNLVWNSWNGTSTVPASSTSDYFLTTQAGDTSTLVDSGVSPDQLYFAGESVYNWITIAPLIDGIPNTSAITLTTPDNYTANGRGFCWDLADNMYITSSGQGKCESWTLGQTSTAVTLGNASGSTGFVLNPGSVAVSAVATTPIAYQANNSYIHNGATPTPAVFTLTMTPPPLSNVVVSFTLTGTATNGVNYNASSSSSVTFTPSAGANEMQTVTITPTANPAAGPSLSVILNVTGSNTYNTISGIATASIANSGPQTLIVTGTGASSMYRPFPDDFVTFTVSRWGDTNATAWSLPYSAFSLGGTAVFGTDYTGGPQPVSYTVAASAGTSGGSIAINPGNTSETVEVGLPVAHGSYTGDKTITLSGTSGSSGGTSYTFLASSAAALLLDNLNPPESVLWSDPLTSPTDENNWNVTFSTNGANIQHYWQDYNGIPGSSPSTPANFDATFGYGPAIGLADSSPGYNYDFVPYPPNGQDGMLRVTVNKSGTITPQSAGVNLYPNNAPVFSGNYALRFSMNLVAGCGSGTATEYVLFGINHHGTNVNWWLGSTDAGSFSFTNTDGIWYAVISDAAQAGNVGAYNSDFLEMTSLNGATVGAFPSTGYEPLDGFPYSSYTNVFKQLDYNAWTTSDLSYDIGVPANISGWAGDNYSSGSCFPPGSANVGPWTDVEVKQFDNVVTMSMNKTVIFTYTNTTVFKSGYPMLGYMDPFTSDGTGGGAYFSNIRVVSLTAPVITSVGLSGGNVVITFTSPDADALPSSFTLYSSGAVNGAYSATAATITESGNVFTAVTPYTAGAQQFFVIKQTNLAQ